MGEGGEGGESFGRLSRTSIEGKLEQRARTTLRFDPRSLSRALAELRVALSSHQSELRAGVKESLRIDRFAVDAGLVMQVRPGRASGRAEPADGLPRLQGLAHLDLDFGQMAVAGRQAVAM